MRVLLIGAGGFLGSALLARLSSEGFPVVATARRPPANEPGAGVEWIALDLRQIAAAGVWAMPPGIDAVINCAGVLQGRAIDDVHVTAPSVIFTACEAAGVNRVIHFSAIGVDASTQTPFSTTKRRAEQLLMASRLDWVILRPSVVAGRAVHGGSGLIRMLAAAPVTLLPADDPVIDVVQLDDVVDTVLFFLSKDAPARVALDLCGPQRLRLSEVVRVYRRWLGFGPAKSIRLPRFAAGLAGKAGDAVSALGWPTALRTTALRELSRGATGDNGPWLSVTGLSPKGLEAALAASPATAQDRWHASLSALRPLLFFLVATFWIGTGLTSIGPGFEIGVDYLRRADVPAPLGALTVIAGGLADIGIGLMILFRRTTRIGLGAAIALSIAYFGIATVILPALWLDPIGPLLKIGPIIALHLACLAILNER